MAVYTYTGRLTDYGGAPFPGAKPKLYVMPKQSGFTRGKILARKQIPVTVASNGRFSVDLEASAGVSPEAVYTLYCQWVIDDVPHPSTEWASFRARSGGGDISDMATTTQPPWSIAYGFGPPPEGVTGLYVDISTGRPVLYAPEGSII